MISWLQFSISILLISVSLSSFAAKIQTTYDRIIVFGDSLSDMGTYALAAQAQGGGKFTTNPGQLWIEVVADKLHLPLAVNRHEGFGSSLNVLGGLNYAQGGSRVMLDIDHSSEKNLTARPISEQINYFANENHNFMSGDVVFVFGGANDLLVQFAEFKMGHLNAEQVTQNMVQAATDLTSLLELIQKMGARHIVILNLPAVEKTPRFLAYDLESQDFLANLISVFNQTLVDKVSAMMLLNGVKLIDFHAFDLNFNENYQKFGFKNITEPACKVDLLPERSALFCSEKTLVTDGADLTYKFSDSIHPTTGYSKVVGEYIFSVIQNSQIQN